MTWIIGIDEAGYGPNLGPLVMSAVAFRIPDHVKELDLWKLLRWAVRRPDEDDDGRLLIEDSKLVYSSARGLAALEYGVLAAAPQKEKPSRRLCEILQDLSLPIVQEVEQEPWYHGNTAVPVLTEPETLAAGAKLFSDACKQAGIIRGLVRSAIVCPARFNQLVDYYGSKGGVLGHGLAHLLPAQVNSCTDQDKLLIFIDKHGGRNSYAAMVQHALPESLVLAHEEGMARSVYSVHGLGREVRMAFQPRADAEHFCVALASMVSKYLRELLMLEFNEFWMEKVDGLKATAGYPGDAARFFEAILPVIKRLGIARETIWRRR